VPSPQELKALQQCDNVWNGMGVLNWLQALVDKSGITGELVAEGAARRQSQNPASCAGLPWYLMGFRFAWERGGGLSLSASGSTSVRIADQLTSGLCSLPWLGLLGHPVCDPMFQVCSRSLQGHLRLNTLHFLEQHRGINRACAGACVQAGRSRCVETLNPKNPQP
jgi:hypothetical protein